MRVWIHAASADCFIPAVLLDRRTHDGIEWYRYRVTRTVGAWHKGVVDITTAGNICGKPRRRGMYGQAAYTLGVAVLHAKVPQYTEDNEL